MDAVPVYDYRITNIGYMYPSSFFLARYKRWTRSQYMTFIAETRIHAGIGAKLRYVSHSVYYSYGCTQLVLEYLLVGS